MASRRAAFWVVFLILGSITACGDDAESLFTSSTTTTPTSVVSTTAPPTTSPVTTLAPATTVPPTTQAPATTQAPGTTLAPGTTSAGQELDWTQTAYYDEFDLQSGFDGDPWTLDQVNAGSLAPVDVSYLGGACVGYANDIPDFEVTYLDGGFTASILRFYFVPDNPGDDTVLIVNAPDGGWYCGDDSYESANPTVDFPNPTYGIYDIWLGTYEEAVLIAGTLYITELDTNHP